MNLVEVGKGRWLPVGLHGWPFKFVKHVADATGVSPSPAGPPGSCPSPMSLALSQAIELKAMTVMDIGTIEQEAGSLALTKRIPTYWSRLGSSKSRTHEQAELGKEIVMGMMMEAPEDTTFAFTDRSCQPNPGQCGAGTVLYPPHRDPVPLKKPVSKR